MIYPKHIREKIRWLRDLGYQLRLPVLLAGSHYKLTAVAPDGRERTFICSHSPSDWRSQRNFQAEVQRFLRQATA